MFSHSLITWLTTKKHDFFFFLHVHVVLCRRYFLPFSLFLPSYTHPLPCTPPPSILLRAWQKPTLPCLLASAPLILLPARHTRRTERKKEKELHLSVRDYRLPLSSDHVCPPSIHKANKWDPLQGVESYRQYEDGSFEMCLLEAVMGTGEGVC